MNDSMKEILKSAGLSLLVAVVVLAGYSWLVGGNQPNTTLGSGTRYPNGISADSTAPSAGEVRGTTFTATGAVSLASTLGVTGATTLSSTLGITGLTTFDGGFQCSSALPTSTPASLTLAASDLIGYCSMVITPTVGAITVTLPTATALASLAPSTGDWVDITIGNATTTAGANGIITFAGNTGVTLQQASSTLAIQGQEIAVLRLLRTGASSFLAYFSQAF